MMNNVLEPEYDRIRRQAYSLGVRETRDKIMQILMQWATTHPDAVVRDELWAVVEKIGEASDV
jgi:hypothetical protein